LPHRFHTLFFLTANIAARVPNFGELPFHALR
jgi:hypothetical protein